jgi:hypothetical protein
MIFGQVRKINKSINCLNGAGLNFRRGKASKLEPAESAKQACQNPAEVFYDLRSGMGNQ